MPLDPKVSLGVLRTCAEPGCGLPMVTADRCPDHARDCSNCETAAHIEGGKCQKCGWIVRHECALCGAALGEGSMHHPWCPTIGRGGHHPDCAVPDDQWLGEKCVCPQIIDRTTPIECPSCGAPIDDRGEATPGGPMYDAVVEYVVYACGSDTLGPHHDGPTFTFTTSTERPTRHVLCQFVRMDDTGQRRWRVRESRLPHLPPGHGGVRPRSRARLRV